MPNAPSKPGSLSSTPAVTAEYNRLLDALRQTSLEQLEIALPTFFEDLTTYLSDLSSRLRRPDGDNPHFDAALVTNIDRGVMIERMLQQIREFYTDLTPEDGSDNLWQYDFSATEELALIDLRDFEDILAIDRMVTLGEDLYAVPLEALTVRLAVLIGEEPIYVRLPVHVRQICRAFQQAIAAAGIRQEVLGHIYDYFAKRFVRQLEGYYANLNRMLAERGICPEVEKEIRTKGSILARMRASSLPERKSRPRKSAEQRRQPGGQDTGGGREGGGSSDLDQYYRTLGQQIAGALGRFTPVTLYRSVVNALNFKREAEGLADSDALEKGIALSGTWDGATVPSYELDQDAVADARSIADALASMQRDPRARRAVLESNSLRAYLAEHRDSFDTLQNTSGLTAESLNQLDMVDNLFSTIRSQVDVSAELKPVLDNLQIPLAKLALLDPRFFLDQGHNAREFVNRLSRLATSANFPNKALESRINEIVDDVVADYEHDASVFDDALQRIDRLLAQQERALARNIERVVRTQEGQQRLTEARREVARLISARLDRPTAPSVLMELIDSGWRDLLVLTHVKEGPASDNFAEQLRHLDLLLLWLGGEDGSETSHELLMERGLEAETLIDLIGQEISSALPTNLEHEPVLDKLREILAGQADVEVAPVPGELAVTAREPREVRAKIEDLPRLRRWIKRVEQLEKDSWLTYRDRQGRKKRMQLAWISPEHDRFIFVNERGQKVADMSSIKLARQLSQGVQPPAPADRLAVVDQSMYQTLEHVQKTLSFARNHDSLTRLINRDTFLDQVGRALRHARARTRHHAVLYLNVDKFRLVNEVYDRVSGDQVLLEFARLLAQLHGKKSSSARIDSDEFAILLLDHTPQAALAAAEKIRSDIEASSVDIEGENVSFTVSIGVTPIQEHSPEVEVLLDNARSAMQTAKGRGRNQVALYAEEPSEIIAFRREKQRTLEDFERSLETDRFVLRAQPIVKTAVSGERSSTTHYELLLSLRDDDGRLSSPEEFIRSAERYGFMTLVDRWVVREAFSWISQLMDEQKVVPDLAINLSGSSVTDDAFMEYLLEQISEFGVGTSRLCFEITETGTISNLVKAADFVRAFRNIGCKFSIDDFGTGLSSHNYLRELPVDYVKIDGSFVTNIHRNRTDFVMARSINDLAHFLGQETIAEGVENDDIVAKLQEIGVDHLQGWGVGMPKPLAEVTADLANLEK